MDNGNLSIYDLVTKLCEKYISAGSESENVPCRNLTLKGARSRCYEILLSKKPSEKSIVEDLENIRDPLCHLLAWQFQLKKLGRPQYANKLQECVEKLKKLNVFENKAYTNAVLFLLQLRGVPPEEEKIMETTLNRDYIKEVTRSKSYTYFDDDAFKLPNDPDKSSFFSNERFKLHEKRTMAQSTSDNILKVLNSQQDYRNMNFNRYSSSTDVIAEVSIWETASKEPANEHRTWETFGCYGSVKELPFLCEAGPKPASWLHALSSSIENLIVPNRSTTSRHMVTHMQFIKDLKYLLVGIESNTFTYIEGKLCLVPNVYIEGLSYGAIASFCEEFIFASHCYRGLNDLCEINPSTLKYKCDGYIFAELCESIKRYLSYYRVAVLSIPIATHLLSLHQQIKQVCAHLRVLASVCKVGPFEKQGETAHGVVLLNNLYQKVMKTTDESILMVLYSILHPCCQVYFVRFLQQWIMEGKVNDPYGEFFISIHPKYITTHGRTYWTRSFTLLEDIIPDFISELREDVLFCGKAMNLLKLCIPNSPLCLFFANKHPNLISCCVIAKQLTTLEQNNNTYYLEATALSGPRISLVEIITRSHSKDDLFLSLVAKKRTATLARIELERKKRAEVLQNKKRAEMQEIKAQYAEALRVKQVKVAEEFQEEIRSIEKSLSIQTLHDRIIEDEASNLIEYYKDLYKALDSRRAYFEKRIQAMRKVHLEGSPLNEPSESLIEINSGQSMVAMSESYHTACDEDLQEIKSDLLLADIDSHDPPAAVDDNLDVLNANAVMEVEVPTEQENESVRNFRQARKNKAKVLSLELGIDVKEPAAIDTAAPMSNNNLNLTEAQRNKLRVMSSEYGFSFYSRKTDPIDSKTNLALVKKTSNIMEINKRKMMSSNDCFYEVYTTPMCDDNKNFLNKNNAIAVMDTETNEDPEAPDANSNVPEKWVHKKQDTLSLDFTQINNNNNNTKETEFKKPNYPFADTKMATKSPKFELEKLSPMSIDSTPLSAVTTPSNRLIEGFGRNDPDNSTATTTAASRCFEAGFCFEMDTKAELTDMENRSESLGVAQGVDYVDLSRSVSMQEADLVSPDCLERCLTQSLAVPLIAQIKLLTNELLKYFINDLHYLRHLNSLRCYFFLMDGEFARHMTEGLFGKLYGADFPADLINHRTLQELVCKAIDYSTKCQANSSCLSFRINSLPKVFRLRDPDILNCISLTYKITWPLNILLPSDTVAKYDEVFKFLLKLHRISWVLRNVFLDLKSLTKELESRTLKFLMMSPQYRRLNQCRHVMAHFVQTLQSYVVGEVLQSSWKAFERNLESVTSFDQLYALHTAYIKNILFMCLLNQKSAPLRDGLQKIFIVILKFYDYLRSRMWLIEGGYYVHPNFHKLELTFRNFQELVAYFFKVGHRVVKSGYQPHLLQLLDMLDVNNYYTKTAVNNTTDVSSISVASR